MVMVMTQVTTQVPPVPPTIQLFIHQIHQLPVPQYQNHRNITRKRKQENVKIKEERMQMETLHDSPNQVVSLKNLSTRLIKCIDQS
jgi:hypothetical protein